MSETPATPPVVAPAAPAAPAKKGGAIGMILGMILPALLAAGAAFGAAKVAGKGGPAHAAPEEEPAHHALVPKPPGPTVPLDPFLVSVIDGAKKAHPLKLSVAIEFGSTDKEDLLKPFMPRIRDTILTYVRSLSYEEAVDAQHSTKLREDLLERCHKVGALTAEKVLITDLVSQ
jgi:flagellar basal body-associated protein FliL